MRLPRLGPAGSASPDGSVLAISFPSLKLKSLSLFRLPPASVASGLGFANRLLAGVLAVVLAGVLANHGIVTVPGFVIGSLGVEAAMNL